MKGLLADARKLLKANGGIPKPVRRPTFDPPPPLDEARAVWDGLRPMADETDILLQFNDRYSHLKIEGSLGYYDLWTFAVALKKAGDIAGAIEVASVAVRQRSMRSSSNWWVFLVERLVEARRLDEAIPAIRQVCLRIHTYQDSLLAVLRYYEARGDRESASLFQFAIRLCGTACFAGETDYGRPPRDWRDRFAAILDSWIEPLWDPSKLPLDQIHRVSRYGEEYGGKALRARAVDAAREFGERRDRINEIVTRAPNGSTQETLDALARWPIPLEDDDVAGELFRLAHLLAARGDRLAAVALYERVVCSRREVWWSGNVLQGFNNLLILYHQTGQIDRAMHLMPDALRVAPENPFIYHSAACLFALQGDWERALALVIEAKKRNYEHMDKIAKDENLAPLRVRPEFAALFSFPLPA